MDIDFRQIEANCKKFWEDEKIYQVKNDTSKPKYYVLDMFPYPSGDGLHVGHPLGYVASDIYARFKRLNGFNVLHPMGFDAFGLPAEQYAIETGMHPTQTTAKNIATYKKQFENIGFSFDWSREVVTSDPNYYKWTQWIFTKLFNHCYCTADDKAQPIELLIGQFEKDGNLKTAAFTDYKEKFTADDWKKMSAKEQADVLMHYRLAYRKVSYVNWCEALGTVLANDEVVNGVSERGQHPVIQKPMLQWSLRITAYAERLLNSLDKLDWSDSLIIQQKNWIGRSEGALVDFEIASPDSNKRLAPAAEANQLKIFTTRPDTIFGVTFMVMAPEHPLLDEITSPEQKIEVETYREYAKSKSAVERQADKSISGVNTGAFVIHPFTKKQIPIWVSEYVFYDYGTGAIMAVPSDDERDNRFAKHFGIDIIEICDKSAHPNAEIGDKNGTMINSDFLNGLEVKDAIKKILAEIEQRKIGTRQVNYKLRDANFSRQRYWGEPFPIYYKDGIAHSLPESELPLKLPDLDDFKPENGQAPLSKAKNWEYNGYPLDIDTMPGNAGSSWYFLRYMDADNPNEFCSKQALDYWQDVDLYVGGTEHAVGHLMYARFWHKFLYDIGLVPTNEPFKKLINQGMIQGESAFVYRHKELNTIVSAAFANENHVPIRIAISAIQDNGSVNIDKLKAWREEYMKINFETEDGLLIPLREVEKMSKSKYNVVNPDDVIAEYGADCFRMFEMFLGPIEMHKPWNTKGIDGVAKFIRKFWHLFYTQEGAWQLTKEAAHEKELKSLHACIKKINFDMERFSFNTCISTFMICVNELNELNCHKEAVLKPLLQLMAPFAPFITEHLWKQLDEKNSIHLSSYPKHNEQYLVESSFEYPVSVNGKMRTKIDLDLDMNQADVEKAVLANDIVQKWLEGKSPKKFIFVKGKIINLVV